MFLSLFKCPLLTNRTRNQVKNCCMSIFNIIPISSDASLLQFSLKVTCCEIFPFICPHEEAPHQSGFKANSLLISLGAGLNGEVPLNPHPLTALTHTQSQLGTVCYRPDNSCAPSCNKLSSISKLYASIRPGLTGYQCLTSTLRDYS